MFPLCLRIHERWCLVVGGGPVGRRKAVSLLEAGAKVRLVCLEPPIVLETRQQPEWLQELYRPEHMHDVVLAFAAATATVNRQVTFDAKARGVWVNVADDPEASDFHVPANLRRGDLLLTVSTGGAAPGLAKVIRNRLAEDYDAAFAEWVNLVGEFRPVLHGIADPDRRQQLFELVTRWQWVDRIRNDGAGAVRAEWRRLVVD